MVVVVEASTQHFDAFIQLAAEVEDWFGPMVNEDGFHAAVRKNTERRSALVALDAGTEVVGGILFSRHRAPEYEIGWLVVTAARRSEGIGTALVAESLRRWVQLPAVVSVVTFGVDHPGARSRRFYERLGFEPSDVIENGPDGRSRQRFRLKLETLPDWSG